MTVIAEIIERLTDAARREPDMAAAGAWRNGKPPDGLSLPYPDAAVLARAERCIVVGVRVGPRNDGFLTLDDRALAEITGRH